MGLGKRANLAPESVGLEAQQPTLFPFELWSFDPPTDSPQDLILADGVRLSVDDLTVRDDLIVTDDENVMGDLDVDGALNVDGTAQIDGEAHFDANIHAKSTVQVDGEAHFDANVHAKSTMSIDGAATLGSTLGVTGVTTLTGGKRVGVHAEDTTPFTFSDTDGIEYLLVTTGASAFTVNLPTAADNTGRIITIRKVDTGAGKITVDGEGSETIDGNTTVGIWYVNNFLTLLCTGSAWLIVGAPPYIRLPVNTARYSSAATPAASNWTAGWDISSYIPIGAKSVELVYFTIMTASAAGAAESEVCVEAAKTSTPTYQKSWLWCHARGTADAAGEYFSSGGTIGTVQLDGSTTLYVYTITKQNCSANYYLCLHGYRMTG